MNNQLTMKLDMLSESTAHLMAVSFSKTSSQLYPLALKLAQAAEKYDEAVIGNKLMHFAVFARNRNDAASALLFLRYATGWKSTQVFAGGKLITNIYRVKEVLECYLEATACDDRKAHCYKIINDPYSEFPYAYAMGVTIRVSLEPEQKEDINVDRYVFPCSKLHGHFKFMTDHPSTAEDQIQARAVEIGLDWCPFFNKREYIKTGTQAKAKT
jgi:hypothetical protein